MLTEELPACTYSREKGDVSDDDEKLDARASSVWLLLLRGSTKAADRMDGGRQLHVETRGSLGIRPRRREEEESTYLLAGGSDRRRGGWSMMMGSRGVRRQSCDRGA